MTQEWTETSRRIIVIDDNEAIHNDFKTLLTPKEKATDLDDLESELFGAKESEPVSHEYELDFALQGQIGVEKVRKAREEGVPFALAFVDMRMPPGWDGLETIRRLWECDPEVQVVLCTAYSDYSYEEIANAFPHTDSLLILKKPFAIEEVAQLARALTSKWLLAREVAKKMDDLDTQLAVRTGSLQRVYAQLVHDMEELERTKKDFGTLQEQLRQTERIESIGLLAGGIAYEFNKLLTPITGYSDLILSRLTPEDKFYNKVHEILKAALRAREITQQLLAFSGNQDLSMRAVDVNALLHEFKKLIQDAAGDKVEVIFELSPEPQYTLVDTAQFQEVLEGFAGNAREAMSNGGSLILGTKRVALDEAFCQTNPVLTAGDYVLLFMQDTGCGMAPETLARLFEPFFTTKENGTGLGLAAAYGIIRQHGGVILAESLEGAGATFKIYLPAVNEGKLPE